MSEVSDEYSEFRSEACGYINKTPPLLSLLYDIDLLPEQCKVGSRECSQMISITRAFEAATPQWYGIETAPKDGTRILGYGKDFKHEVLYWGGTVKNGYWTEINEGYEQYHPTHWQPLPSPPIPKEKP